MIAGAIIIIAIATTGVLMLRFCKRWLAKINIAFTNRITGLFAGWLPGFGILNASRSEIRQGLPDASERFSSAGGISYRTDLWTGKRVG